MVLPALALALAAVTWRRHSVPQPMPRLPVRRKSPRSSTSARADLAGAPAPDVVVPHWFWDAGEMDQDERDDPAEIPHSGLPLVSEASQSAAVLDPADHEASSAVLHW
ncbi:MAG TPA: hypothetical protein VFS67_13035 [Polyangiaceae bacterium]|nr:hypothetical protein [Polyangiaceae bacterium]